MTVGQRGRVLKLRLRDNTMSSGDTDLENRDTKDNTLGVVSEARVLSSDSDSKVFEAISTALKEAKSKAFRAVNSAMVQAYWEIGRVISNAVGDRAEYGKHLLKYLSLRLTAEFGKGFDESNLRNIRRFFQAFPIRDALRHELTWTHYRLLMRIEETGRREFYLKECADSG